MLDLKSPSCELIIVQTRRFLRAAFDKQDDLGIGLQLPHA